MELFEALVLCLVLVLAADSGSMHRLKATAASEWSWAERGPGSGREAVTGQPQTIATHTLTEIQPMPMLCCYPAISTEADVGNPLLRVAESTIMYVMSNCQCHF